MSEYNGWTNWETWTTQFYFDGNEEYYVELYAEDVARGNLDRYYLGKALEQDFVDMVDLPGEGWAADMCNGALGEVNWTEIGEMVLDRVKSSDAYREALDGGDDDEQEWLKVLADAVEVAKGVHVRLQADIAEQVADE